jgi:hypothetical protein
MIDWVIRVAGLLVLSRLPGLLGWISAGGWMFAVDYMIHRAFGGWEHPPIVQAMKYLGPTLFMGVLHAPMLLGVVMSLVWAISVEVAWNTRFPW